MNIILIAILFIAVVISWKAMYNCGKSEWYNKYEDLKETMEPQGVWLDKYKREMEFHDSLRRQHEKLKERNFKSLLEKNQLNDYAVAVRYYASLLLMWLKDYPHGWPKTLKNLTKYKQMMKAITDVPDCYRARPEKYPSLSKAVPTDPAQEQAHSVSTACSCKRCERCWELREKLRKIRFMHGNATLHALNAVILRETECVSFTTKTSPKRAGPCCEKKQS